MPSGNPPRDVEDLFPYVDLRKARLCLDCEMIFDAPRCPACASASFIPVTRWIRPSLREIERAAPAEAPVAGGASPMKPPKRLLRKSVYVGLGAYGLWKMLFEPPKPRKRRPSAPKERAEPEETES